MGSSFLVHVRCELLDKAKTNFQFSVFCRNSSLPPLISGHQKCTFLPLSIAQTIKTIHGDQSLSFLYRKYQEFAKNQYKNSSIQNLHYVFSNLFAMIRKPHRCLPIPAYFIGKFPNILSQEFIPNNDFWRKIKIPEVFYFHHSLRFADPKILKYILNRDIMDIGAFTGDSAFVLQNYTNKNIFSYEVNSENIKAFKKNSQDFNMDQKKIFLIPKGISNKVESISINPCGRLSGACQITKSKQKNSILQMTTIDAEVKEHNMTLGFFKADIEGFSYECLQGATYTLHTQQPVFSISIYHNYNELFKIPEIMEQFPDYEFEWQIQAVDVNTFGEMVLFAYPKKIIKDEKMNQFIDY